MSGACKSLFSLKSRGTVVEHCRKCIVGRRRASLSSWVSSYEDCAARPVVFRR